MYGLTQVIVGGSQAWQWTSSEVCRFDPRFDIFFLAFVFFHVAPMCEQYKQL